MTSSWEAARSKRVSALIDKLVVKFTDAEIGSENWQLAKDFVESNFKYHRFGSLDPKLVLRSFDTLVAGLQLHAKDTTATDLETLTRRFFPGQSDAPCLGIPGLVPRAPEQDSRAAILCVLHSLSGDVYGAAPDAPSSDWAGEVTPYAAATAHAEMIESAALDDHVEMLGAAIEEDESLKAYLADLNAPSESWSDDDDDDDDDDDGPHPSSEPSSPPPPTPDKEGPSSSSTLPDGAQSSSQPSTPSTPTQLSIHDITSELIESRTLLTAPCALSTAVHIASSSLVSAPSSAQIMTEKSVLRAVLWTLLSGATSSTLILTSEGTFIPANITLAHSSPAALSSLLSSPASWATILHRLDALVARTTAPGSPCGPVVASLGATLAQHISLFRAAVRQQESVVRASSGQASLEVRASPVAQALDTDLSVPTLVSVLSTLHSGWCSILNALHEIAPAAILSSTKPWSPAEYSVHALTATEKAIADRWATGNDQATAVAWTLWLAALCPYVETVASWMARGDLDCSPAGSFFMIERLSVPAKENGEGSDASDENGHVDVDVAEAATPWLGIYDLRRATSNPELLTVPKVFHSLARDVMDTGKSLRWLKALHSGSLELNATRSLVIDTATGEPTPLVPSAFNPLLDAMDTQLRTILNVPRDSVTNNDATGLDVNVASSGKKPHPFALTSVPDPSTLIPEQLDPPSSSWMSLSSARASELFSGSLAPLTIKQPPSKAVPVPSHRLRALLADMVSSLQSSPSWALDTPPSVAIASALALPIRKRAQVVSKYTQDMILYRCGLLAHLEALKGSFLCSSGAFAFAWGATLATKLAGSTDVNELQAALEDALDEAGGLGTDVQLRVYLEEGADRPQLDYSVPWPLDSIIDAEAMNSYRTLHSHIMRIKHARYVLDHTADRRAQEITSSAPRRLVSAAILFRSHLDHLVRTIEGYTMLRVVQPVWQTFRARLEASCGVGELIRLHRGYLSTLLDRCLLGPKSTAVADALGRILSVALQFDQWWHQSVINWSAEPSAETALLVALEPLAGMKAATTSAVRFLVMVLTAVVSKSSAAAPTHLADLLLQLDFNGFYSATITQ